MPRLTGRLATAFTAVLAVVALASIIVACGGDDSSDGGGGSAQAYFTELESVFGDSEAAVAEAEATLESAATGATTLEEKVALSADYVAALAQVYRDTIERMGELDPPEGAVSYHDDFVEALEAAADLSEELEADLEFVITEEELDSVLEQFDSDADAVLSGADSACRGLQAEADGAGVEVDLGCGS